MPEPMFDVYAVRIGGGGERRMDGPMTEANADAYIKMAVYRRGVEEEFFTMRPAAEEARDALS